MRYELVHGNILCMKVPFMFVLSQFITKCVHASVPRTFEVGRQTLVIV